MTTEEINSITIEDKNYPESLKKIKDPPKALYLKGRLEPEESRFAMVGARLCSAYGKQTALEIAGKLAEAGLTIVSGLAPGIDTFVHEAVLERIRLRPPGFGGRAIAVLGTGLDKKSIYPQSNLKLAERILETGGCLISEYPPGTQGARFTFPRRNRIISGLSIGMLVIEAKEKSGALITAGFAREQKRKVFAVPGSIYSLNSKGCNGLIKTGAKLVESADDILEELNLSRSSGGKGNHLTGENAEENLILEALREGPSYIDKIIGETKLSAAETAGSLAVLEIKGKVRNLGGNVFALKR